MDLLCCCCTPWEYFNRFIIAALVVGISPFSAFSHMMQHIFVDRRNSRRRVGFFDTLFEQKSPRFLLVMLWSSFSVSIPFLLTLWLIPYPVIFLQQNVPTEYVIIICLSLFFFFSIFLPVFVTIRAGMEWKIIDTRYHYQGPLNFHIVQKVQQILGPMVSVAELNWKSSYEFVSLVENVHLAIYAPDSQAPQIVSESLATIRDRSDMDEMTKQKICQLVCDMRSNDYFIRRQATSLNVRFTLANFIAFSHIFIEFLQLTAITLFDKGSPWPLDFTDSIPNQVVDPLNFFGISILRFESSTLNIISFWIILGVVGLWLWMTTPLHWANVGEIFLSKRFIKRRNSRASNDSDFEIDSTQLVEEEEYDNEISAEQKWYNAASQVTKTYIQRILLFIIDDVAFFVIVVKLCGFLGCDYDSLKMTQVQELSCLSDEVSITYGIFAMLGLLYYVFTSFCYTSMQSEVQSEIVKDFDVQFDHQFTGIERLLKMSGACAMALFGSYAYIPQGVSCFVSLGLLLLLSRQSSCTVYFVDFWRRFLLVIVLFGSLTSFVVILTDNLTSPIGIYIFASASFFALCFCVVWWRGILVHVRKPQINNNDTHGNNELRQNHLLESLINSRGSVLREDSGT
eukprot:c19245_g1_i1.p1 GENE.c19245_g1_i1~~c19245_g1_i1.p1  ORF type:complete len:625 (-),score=150.59 c19245_g1_i1:32-1906(-)